MLKETFVRLVELAKKKEDIKLDMKVGYLNISAANELYFENYDPSETPRREQKAQEFRSIDPGRLSSALSTHSSYFVSVRTPGTAARGSTASSRRWDAWSQVGRSGGEPNTRSRAKQDAKSVSEAIERLSNSNLAAIPEMREEVPYPHLASFIEKAGGQRFGKKVKVDEKLSHKDVMGYQLEEIKEKAQRRLDERAKKQREDGELLQEIRAGIERERSHNAGVKLKKQEELRRNLEEGKKVARELRSIERDYRQEVPPEYFPFTHGERIENQRF